MTTRNQTMTAIWRATVACCIAMEDSGWSVDDIADAMPDAMKALSESVLRRQNVLPYLLDGGAVVAGRDYARQVVVAKQRRDAEVRS